MDNRSPQVTGPGLAILIYLILFTIGIPFFPLTGWFMIQKRGGWSFAPLWLKVFWVLSTFYYPGLFAIAVVPGIFDPDALGEVRLGMLLISCIGLMFFAFAAFLLSRVKPTPIY